MKICVSVGTRPEAIKLAPVIRELRKAPENKCIVHLTGQHPDMAAKALSQFDIVPDTVGDLSSIGSDLNARFGAIMSQVERLSRKFQPDWMIVHGDTATAAASALGGFHTHAAIAHVEAGLRTGNLAGPWPEEGYRSMIARFARLHFASTPAAKLNLLAEGISESQIIVTGNTVVDALLQTVARLEHDVDAMQAHEDWYNALDLPGRMVLVTLHRRENHGDGIAEICAALRNLANRHPDIGFLLPIHPNPAVRGPVTAALAHSRNIRLINPVDYTRFVFLMLKCSVILTDSGGIQEEAPSLRRPVIVMRNETERPEAVAAGFSKLTGPNSAEIERIVTETLSGDLPFPKTGSPFGDGKSAVRIASALGATTNRPQPVVVEPRPKPSSRYKPVISCANIHPV